MINSGVFYGGEFRVTQKRSKSGLTNLQLVGGSAGACASRAGAGQAPAAVTASSGVRRLLRGSAHGQYRTVGGSASATVRGTIWLTEDRCDGTTYIATQRGSVTASDLHSNLNLAPLQQGPGDSSVWYCNQNDQPIPSSFCTGTVSSPSRGLITGAIVSFGTSSTYDLCFIEPSSSTGCISTLPFSGVQANGSRVSVLICTPFAGSGNYLFNWRLNGVVLQPGLPASSNKPAQFRQCDLFPGATPVQPPP